MVRSMDDLDILGRLYSEEVIKNVRKDHVIRSLENEISDLKTSLTLVYNNVTSCDKAPKHLKEYVTKIVNRH